MIFCRLVNGSWEMCKKEDPGARAFRMQHNHDVNDLLNLLNFLFWYEQESPRALWGGVTLADALESCRKLLNFDEDRFETLEKICLGEIKDESPTSIQ